MKSKIYIFLLSLNLNLFSQSSLNLSTSADAISLGEALTSFSSMNSAKYNPATLELQNLLQTSFSHSLGFGNTNSNSLILFFGDTNSSSSINLQSTSIDDIEYRLLPGEPIGNFGYKFLNLQYSYAFNISSNYTFGASIKTTYEKIFVDDAFGFLFDVGVLSKLNDQIKFGTSILNLGVNSKLNNTSSPIPKSFRVGLNYTPINNFNLLSDLVLVNNEKTKFNFGTLYNFDAISIFAGYYTGNDIKSYSFGCKIKFANTNLHIAYQPLKYDLGNIQAYDITIEF
ncbi:MAG: hypothetical protein O3A55_07070 [Bacteroidetes bacterium]|nr:hypothetical protein [Bacteroidota bacterium]